MDSIPYVFVWCARVMSTLGDRGSGRDLSGYDEGEAGDQRASCGFGGQSVGAR